MVLQAITWYLMLFNNIRWYCMVFDGIAGYYMIFIGIQGGTCCVSARAALTERSGSSTKGRTPNIRYFVAKPSIVAIYVLFVRLSQGFQRHPAFIELTTKAILLSKSFQQKPSCFRRAFNESHLAFEELSTKAILLS